MAELSADELWDRVEAVVGDYAARDGMLDELEQYYFLEGDQDRAAVAEQEGIELVRGPHGTNAVDLMQDLLSEAELQIVVPARSENVGDKRVAQEAETWLAGLVAETERAQGQGFLERASWLVAMRGALAARVLFMYQRLEKDEDGSYVAGNRSPLVLQLRDPRNVYPQFGYDGVEYVVERWTRRVGDVRRSWGDDLLPGRREDDEVEWSEYWDSEVFCYWADGEQVAKPVMIPGLGEGAAGGPWRHGYGGCPYVYRFARQTGKRQAEKRARPLLEGVRGEIDRLNLLDSMEATFVAQYAGDALIVYSEDDEFRVDTRPGAVNYLRPGERVEWLRAGRAPAELSQARAKHEALFERGTFPHTMYGADPGRMMAGYALNVLNQGGMIRIRPLLRCVEEMMADLLGRALMVAERLMADLLGRVELFVLGDAEQEDGSSRRVRQVVALDAEKLEGWWVVECGLGEVLPADEQSNLVMALRAHTPGQDGRPLLSWETVVERYKLVTSPADERMRIEREMARRDPVVWELEREILVAETKRELLDKLRALGVDVDAAVARAEARAAERNVAPGAGRQGPMEQPGMAGQGMAGAMGPMAGMGEMQQPGQPVGTDAMIPPWMREQGRG